MGQEWATRSRLPDEGVPMNLFGEEAVITGSTSAVRRVATDIAGRPS